MAEATYHLPWSTTPEARMLSWAWACDWLARALKPWSEETTAGVLVSSGRSWTTLSQPVAMPE